MDHAGRMTWVDWLRDESKAAGRAQLRGGSMVGPRGFGKVRRGSDALVRKVPWPERRPHGRAARCLERCAGGLMHLCGKYPGPLGRLPRAGRRWWSGGRSVSAPNISFDSNTLLTLGFIVLSGAPSLGPPAPTRSVGHRP